MNPAWSEPLAASVRNALSRMDTTMTLAQVKAALARHLVHRQRVRTAMAPYERELLTNAAVRVRP